MNVNAPVSTPNRTEQSASERPQVRMNRVPASSHRIPKWAYLLFIILAAFVCYRILQRTASEVKPAQPPARPALVAKVVTKDVPVYLDEIGTCAAYETVQVQAQVSGQIIARHFQDGSDVKQGDPLFTDFTVAENDLPTVRKYLGGPNVKVQTYLPDGSITPRTGDLYFIDNAVQPGSGTVKARAVTPNPDRALWPSEFVRVRFILDMLTNATLVPSQAVQVSQSGPFVFVVKPDNTVDLRPVKPGQRQEGDLTVIESGVTAGETVVVTGQLSLSPGAKVAPQPYVPQNPSNPQQSAASKSTM